MAYRSALRADQAAMSRRRVVTAAGEAFAELGYRRTTLRMIAGRAGVSLETVQSAGAKRELLVAAFNLLFVGDGEPAEFASRPAVAALIEDDDRERITRGLAAYVAAGNAAVADLWVTLIAAAADEPDVAGFLEDLHRRARADIRALGARLVHRGVIALSHGPERTADLVWDVQCPEGYLHLVRHAGWSEEDYTTELGDRFLRYWLPAPA